MRWDRVEPCARRAALPPPRRSCRCRRRARRRGGALPRSPRPSPATCSAMPAVNNVNPCPGRRSAAPRPASPTRYSSSSPPSRSATASDARNDRPLAGSPRTSAATASVTARHAVWQRPSQWVRRESAGASSNRRSRLAARATPSGAQYITDPLPALTSGPRRSKTVRALPRAAPSDRSGSRRRADRSRATPTCRASTSSEIQRALVLDQRPPQVPRHRGVVGPGPGRHPHPRQLERGQRIGDLGTAPELERGAQRIPHRQTEDAADRPFPLVGHRAEHIRRSRQPGLW